MCLPPTASAPARATTPAHPSGARPPCGPSAAGRRTTRFACSSHGGVVVSDPRYVHDGSATFKVVTDEEAARRRGHERRARQVGGCSSPAVFVPAERGGVGAVYSEESGNAAGTHAWTVDAAVLLRCPADYRSAGGSDGGVARGWAGALLLRRTWLRQRIRAWPAGAGRWERASSRWAHGIATGLAQADARADHATLAAVGAARDCDARSLPRRPSRSRVWARRWGSQPASCRRSR